MERAMFHALPPLGDKAPMGYAKLSRERLIISKAVRAKQRIFGDDRL
jgi:hypothetical protein